MSTPLQLVADGWTIDAALHPWQEGTRLLVPGDVVVQSADRVLLNSSLAPVECGNASN